jgi:hypothetical protein
MKDETEMEIVKNLPVKLTKGCLAHTGGKLRENSKLKNGKILKHELLHTIHQSYCEFVKQFTLRVWVSLILTFYEAIFG